MFATPVLADVPIPLNLFVEGITEEQIDTMAVDPQSWVMLRDTTWADFLPNPVADWMGEHNPDNLFNPMAIAYGQQKPIVGALLLIDFLDRPMISGQPRGSDVLGFYMYDPDGSGYDYDAGHIKNPVISVLDFPELYPNGYGDLDLFWGDYLNNPEAVHLNHGATIDEYYREMSYGQWAFDLRPTGVYTIPYMEFEVSQSYASYRDLPPSFRYTLPTSSAPTTGGGSGLGNERSSGFKGHAATVAREGAADAPAMLQYYQGMRDVMRDYGITEFGGLSRADKTPFGDYDFIFYLHAGYCQSGSWQAFGPLQAPSRAALAELVDPITGEKDPLGPKGRLRIIEEFFNENPEWVPVYARRYETGWANNTAAWHANTYNASDLEAVARINGVYRQTRFWVEALHDFRVAFDPNYADFDPAAAATWEFKLSQEDWDWAENYHTTLDYVGRTQQRNTRYVDFTSWEGRVGYWSGAASTGGGTGFGGTGHPNGDSLRDAVQGENSGMGTFAHEFGHVAGWGDNYQGPYADSRSPATEYWDIMSRGSFAGPFGDLARWSVPGVEGGSTPVHAMFGLKQRGAGSPLKSWYNTGDVLTITYQSLAGSTPVVANVVSRNIPLNTQYNDFGVPVRSGNHNTNDGFVKAIAINFGSGAWADQVPASARISNATSNGTAGGGFALYRSAAVQYAVEVVDRSSYDSYTHDSGVLLSRVSSTSSGARDLIDSHLHDIDLVDYFINDEGKPSVRDGIGIRFPVAHAAHQASALFKAGKSYVDTGYYGSIRNVAEGNNRRNFPTTFTPGHQDSLGNNGTVLIPGSVQRWEDRIQYANDVAYERPIVAGDSVNEWRDEHNRLHFYILQKYMNVVEPHGEDGHYDHKPFLSYAVAVRHDNGQAVGGELLLEEGAPIIPAKQGNYTKQTYAVTNTGNATDIVRVTLTGPIVDVAPRSRTIQVPWNGGVIPSINEGGTAYTFNPNNRDIYIDRVVPTFFSEQNAVVFNDLYAIGPNETIEFDVWVKTVTGTSADFDVTVKVSSETNSAKFAEAGMTVVADALATAYVNQTSGNTNQLFVDVIEFYNDGNSFLFKDVFTIANNASGVYTVGGYKVFVGTTGNTKISGIYLVDWGLEADRTPPAVEEPGAAFLVSATADKNSVKITGNNDWTVTFKVTETYSDGSNASVSYSVLVKKNSSGRTNLGDYTLIYDIAGNGSNIKDFRVVLN